MPPTRRSKPPSEAAFLIEENMASKASEPVSGTETVVIYNKHGPGLILRAGQFYERQEGSVGGNVRTVKEWRQTSESFTVAGPARAFGQDARAPVVGGYAMTPGCPKDLWEKWLEDNRESLLVKNNIIFASSQIDYAGKALELKDVKTGMEPLSQGKDLRVPGSDRVETMIAA
jgi:hypothetical protein